MIAVMGLTGSGKSSFIDLLTDLDVTIGHALTSCTMEVQIYSFMYKDTQRVYLIDTPGFDDTNRTDTDVLKDIAFFLSQTYKFTFQLSGIIYLHRITDNRMSGSSVRNLTMFKKLCREDAYRHVILATTVWTTVWDNLNGPNSSFEDGVRREQLLVSDPRWWGLMYQRGSKVVRHTGEAASAMRIVSELVRLRKREGTVVLNIQDEMVNKNKLLEDTAAGQEFQRELNQAREQFKIQLADIKQSHDRAMKDRDVQLASILEEQRLELEARLKQADDARQDLKIGLAKLSEEKTAEYNELLREFQAQQQRNREEVARQQAEFSRLQIEREADAERHRLQSVEFERKVKESNERIQEALRKRDLEEAERKRAEKTRMERQIQEMNERFAREQELQRLQSENLRAQLAQAQSQTRKRASTGSLIGLLAGLGTTALGMVTLNPAAIMAGTSMIGVSIDNM